MAQSYLHEELTDKIIGAFYDVYNTLGFGFLEKVYRNALYLELKSLGLQVQMQFPINVYYGENIVGQYYADIVVEDKVILELKAVEKLVENHEIQLVNYLRSTNIEVGLLLNFGVKVEIKRRVLSNWKKINQGDR